MNVLSFLGDVWLPRPFKSRVEINGPYIFNLESPITRSTRPATGKVNLKAESGFFAATFGRNPIAVCLANNHIADYGREGFNDTIDALKAARIKFFGAGTIEDNGHNPLVMDVCGLRVGLMGYVCRSTHPVVAEGTEPGAMPIDLQRIGRDIITARRQGAVSVVVHLHWGEQNIHLPKPGDVKIARDIIGLGADLIIGHHAHCVQACEIYRGKSIFYGLGNAVFPDLDLPSYFGADGRPSRRRVGTQKYWNKRSLMVEYDPHSESVRLRRLVFDREQLDERLEGSRSPFCSDLGAPGYELRYVRAWKWSKLREAVANFLSRPKLPRMKHIRSIVSLAVRRA